MLSEKQKIYVAILRYCLPIIRNGMSVITHIPWWQLPGYRRSVDVREKYHMAELVHAIPLGFLDEEFTGWDLHFINSHARTFYEETTSDGRQGFKNINNHIADLMNLVPDSMKDKLTWSMDSLE